MQIQQTPINQIIQKSIQVSLSVGMTRFVQMISSFIGMLMVAHLGHDQLSASALITPIQALIFVIGASLITSVGILSAKAFGAKEYTAAGKCFHNGFVIALGLSIIIDIILYYADTILIFLGQPEASVNLAQQYFNIFIIATPLYLCIFVFQQFLIAVDRKRLIVLMSFLSLPVTAILSYGLIYGHLGLPKLGISGLAWSSSIWGLLSIIIYASYLFGSTYFHPFRVFSSFETIQLSQIKQMLKIGLPIAFQSASDILSFLAITFMIGWLGNNALAIQQVVNQYFLLLVVPILSLSQTSSILVAQAYGAKNLFDIKRYGNAILTIGLFFALIVMLLFIIFPDHLILFYAGDDHSFTPDLLHLASIILILTGSRLFLDTIIEVKVGSLRGILDVHFPMIISVILSWIICIPLAYIFCFTFNLGLIGISIAGIIMMLVGACILYIRWVYKTQTIQWKN
ncbi:MATE family efflux transporter [Thiotrichales bacterium 19S3-7]|nr:MATE family efflux transporter [Thiotrichales bacterium 19S3-7]MCF6803031.1 MATE family efflux transporter [Thiotrichales bacterium 19S3-11]